MSDQLKQRGKALENEYFRKKEEELIAKLKEKMEAEDSKVLDLECPRCDGHLVETHYEDILIDVCEKCSGVWLDAGELAQIVDKEEEEHTGWFAGLMK